MTQQCGPHTAAVPVPINAKDRYPVIDSIRGVALLGVFLINATTEFRVSIFSRFLQRNPEIEWIDEWIETVVMLAFDSKALAILSTLLGAGLAAQWTRLPDNFSRFAVLSRRIAFLGVLGVLHIILIWNGDILLHYAIASAFAVPFLLRQVSWSICAAVVLLAYYFATPWLPELAPLPHYDWLARHVTIATNVYATGGFAEILRFRLAEAPALVPLHVQALPRTIALILVGMALWRKLSSDCLALQPSQLVKITIVALVTGVTLTAAARLANASDLWRLAIAAERCAALSIAVALATSVALSISLPIGQRMHAAIGALGQIALSGYLIQSILFSAIFYGFGFGLFGKVGFGLVTALAVAVYVGECLFAMAWLRWFRFGPVEYIWRLFTYYRRVAFRRIVPATRLIDGSN